MVFPTQAASALDIVFIRIFQAPASDKKDKKIRATSRQRNENISTQTHT